MQIFKRLPEAGKDERAQIGQFANQVKTALEQSYEEKVTGSPPGCTDRRA